jgi:predicted ATPase
LFVEEMLLILREAGSDDHVEVPPTIDALLQARLDRLASEERAVIDRGAVEGEVFHRSPSWSSRLRRCGIRWTST